MKIFIDIGHPAHVHYFKNLIKIMAKEDNAKFVVTSRDKEMAHYLLKSNNISFINRGKGKDSVLGKLLYLVKADFQILRLALKEKPDLFISFGAPYVSQVSFLLGVPSITLDDTENAKLGQMFYKPFSKLILSPSTFYKDFGVKHKKFNGYMELSYLHPNYFKPDVSVLNDINLKEGESYSILRFVKWKAHHDIGHNGINEENKILVVNQLLKFGKVFITSEGDLPKEIEKYRINIAPEKIHSILFYAKLFYGESATMASESAVLGTPAIYIDNDGRGYTDEQEKKYGLVFNYNETIEDQKESIVKANEILSSYQDEEWVNKKEKLINDKIDVTNFLIKTIRKYKK
jgi:predicted glycosyltransferase